ncbi:MAG: VWA domain-containing protein [Nitriliruptorales bacterium]|nr:VWA domain-containing protein [Nitriliruptorales bacterium]
MRDLTADLVVFVGLLRRAGLTVATGQVEAFVRAAEAFAPVDRDDVYWSGRLTLVAHHHDLAVYDRVFGAFWRDQPLSAATHQPEPAEAADDVASGVVDGDSRVPDGSETGAGAEPDVVGAVASAAERLRHRRFADATADELRALRALMTRMPVSLPRRRRRRTETVRRGRRPDLRRTFRTILQTDGELIERAWRQRRTEPRPLVLALDVSGSMAGYSRALLQVAHAVRSSVGEIEVFCFGTRLTRVTDDLERRDPDAALAAAAESVVDWDGGTQIGGALAALNREWGRRGVLRGAVVVICSDGLERGDPELLGEEVGRLSRFAHRVVWVNPLKGGRDYEPVQRGMRAALPHVDHFLSGHDLASLDELGEVLGAL